MKYLSIGWDKLCILDSGWSKAGLLCSQWIHLWVEHCIRYKNNSYTLMFYLCHEHIRSLSKYILIFMVNLWLKNNQLIRPSMSLNACSFHSIVFFTTAAVSSLHYMLLRIHSMSGLGLSNNNWNKINWNYGAAHHILINNYFLN